MRKSRVWVILGLSLVGCGGHGVDVFTMLSAGNYSGTYLNLDTGSKEGTAGIAVSGTKHVVVTLDKNVTHELTIIDGDLTGPNSTSFAGTITRGATTINVTGDFTLKNGSQAIGNLSIGAPDNLNLSITAKKKS